MSSDRDAIVFVVEQPDWQAKAFFIFYSDRKPQCPDNEIFAVSLNLPHENRLDYGLHQIPPPLAYSDHHINGRWTGGAFKNSVGRFG